MCVCVCVSFIKKSEQWRCQLSAVPRARAAKRVRAAREESVLVGVLRCRRAGCATCIFLMNLPPAVIGQLTNLASQQTKGDTPHKKTRRGNRAGRDHGAKRQRHRPTLPPEQAQGGSRVFCAEHSGACTSTIRVRTLLCSKGLRLGK